MNKQQLTIESVLFLGIGAISSGITMLQGSGDLIRGLILIAVGAAILVGRSYAKKHFYGLNNNQKGEGDVEDYRG